MRHNSSITEITPVTTLIGYARVSTAGQDHTSQIENLKAAGCTQIFSEKVSGAAPLHERVELLAALHTLQEGDILVIRSLDRLGRTMEDCVGRVAQLLERGINVRTLDGRVDTAGLGKMAKLVVGILSAAAELERELILSRTEEGRARAKAAGVKFGRKRSYSCDQAELVRGLVGQGQSRRQVAKATGLSATTVRRILEAA